MADVVRTLPTLLSGFRGAGFYDKQDALARLGMQLQALGQPTRGAAGPGLVAAPPELPLKRTAAVYDANVARPKGLAIRSAQPSCPRLYKKSGTIVKRPSKDKDSSRPYAIYSYGDHRHRQKREDRD